MKPGSRDTAQAMQRVRVGLTGLAVVLVLIGVASAIFSSANREQAVSAVGASNAVVVANMTGTGGNVASPAERDEPLAEIGVAPSTGATDTPEGAGETQPR